MLSKKEIEFLELLEIKLQTQATHKTKNVKDKLLISFREFQHFYDILDKLEKEYKISVESSKNTIKEKRKNDKGYARPNYYKQYLKDKEEAKQKGIKFTKKISDYK